MPKYRLQLTLENGKVIDAGEIEVKDGVDGAPGRDGIDGKDGVDGKDGLTTSVNGVEQVNGNIQLTPEHIGAARIVTGSYVGNGKCYLPYPNTLTFDFEPKFLWVREDGDNRFSNSTSCQLAVNRGEESSNTTWNAWNHTRKITWDGNTVSWYCETARDDAGPVTSQMNKSGTTYRYVAIG